MLKPEVPKQPILQEDSVKNWMDRSDFMAVMPHRPLDVDPKILPFGISAIDQLMKPDVPPAPMWGPSAPVAPLAPVPAGPDPFGTVPVLPNLKPPIDADPPSRPPQWMFGPPEIANVSPQCRTFHLQHCLPPIPAEP